MKKVALVFVLAVLAPSLLLAWLAVRSLRDQQFLVERQQSLLDQHVTDMLAQSVSDYLAQRQQEFGAQVESMAANASAESLASRFDDQLRRRWPFAEVGFCVTAAGKILSPLPNARPAAQMFRLDNSGFLGNREPVEVYLTANNQNGNANANTANNSWNNTLNFTRGQSSLAMNSYNANNSSFSPSGQLPQSSKSAPQLDTPNAPSASQSFAINGGFGGGGGGGGFGGFAGSNGAFVSGSTMPKTPAGSVMTDSLQPPPQGNTGIASGNRFSNTSGFGSPAHQQAFTFDGSIANRSATKQAAAEANGFYINNSASQKQQPQLPNSDTFAGASSLPPSQSLENGADTIALNQNAPAAAAPPPGFPALAGSVAALPPQPAAAPTKTAATAPESAATTQQTLALNDKDAQIESPSQAPYQNGPNYKGAKAKTRAVNPLSRIYQAQKETAEGALEDSQYDLSKAVPAEAEFRQLIGDQSDGMFARFLQNKLKLMCWHRLSTEPDLIFGAQLDLNRVVDGLRSLVRTDSSVGDEICLALLDDNARPVVLSHDGFQANWKRPFVATEIGDSLPHWEAAAYLVNPARLTQSAQTAKLTLGLLIALLVVAIGIGSLLIVRGLETELKLARQKTDFVSNVSHELKTPLTSIRMFSELLAEGRVADHARQHSYLQIITAEAARLTRLINNVLDFSRMERGEKKYNFQPCDLSDIVRSTAETFRPHLEGAGFKFTCELPAAPIPLRGDADALSQVIVNLLSNAEKYFQPMERRSPARRVSDSDAIAGPGREAGAPEKEILLQLSRRQSPLPHVEVRVLDRGPGVPRGSEEKIFEKFYRAHDSLSSGVQGSGLGLTIARQIARAHGGDVVYEPREGGGSCFILRLPLQAV